MQPLMGICVHGVNRRSENFLLWSDLLFAWGMCTRSRYKRVEIHVVLGCVFNFMMCWKVIYTGLIKTEIGNWNSDGYFHWAWAICENSWWKVPVKSGWASDNKKWKEKCRVTSVLRPLSKREQHTNFRTRDIAVLICTTSLLWGIPQCIKQQLFLANQKFGVLWAGRRVLRQWDDLKVK